MIRKKWISFKLCFRRVFLCFFTSSFLLGHASASASASFSDFRFTVQPADTIGIRDQPLLLNCSATFDDEAPTMQWTRGGVLISPDEDDRREVMADGSLFFSSLVHTRSHRPDEGVYQCKATARGLGTIVSRKAKVQLAYLAKTFAEEPSNVELYLGDTAVFVCRIGGAPTPAVRWYKDGQEIDRDNQRYIIHLDGTLEIGTVHFDDFGRYKCRAENVDKSRESVEAQLRQDSDISTYQAGVAPDFILRPSGQVSLEGSTVELLCAANGRDESGKAPKITWLKDGVTIDLEDEDSRYSLMGQGSLRILNALEGDSGTYTCRATNEEDAVDADASVTVHVAPRVRRRPANTVAAVNTDVTFTCDVYGYPAPSIRWMKNGEVIINSNYFQISDGGRTLRILGLVATDRGVYQCLAENEAGNVQASAQLAILQPGGAGDPYDPQNVPEMGGPELPSKPTHMMAFLVSKRFVTLSWRQPQMSGTTEIETYTVYWTEEGSDRNRMLNTSALEANIQGLEPTTSYTFRVVAVNKAGEGPPETIEVTTHDEVNVPSPPEDLEAVTLTSTSIIVSWAPPAQLSGSVQHYMLFYYEAGETEEHSVQVDELSYTLEELQEFVLYNFYVVAYSENGAGQATDEVMARTFSDVPSAAPQNVTVESVSSTAIVMRWQPPPSDDRNGMITGYKIRYKKDGDRKGAAVTEDANQRSFALNDLERGASYQIRIQALNVNGSGPPTDWITAITYAYDLDESTVPGQPVSLDLRPMLDSVIVGWIPPANRDIRVRGYVLGYGIGVPDVYKQYIEHNVRFFTIKGLELGKEYVISLSAYNNMGEGQPKLATTRTRTQSEPVTPMLPPVGLKAITLSSTAIIVTWSDSTLGRSQRVTDNRYYTIRYSPSTNPTRYKYINCTELNQHIDDLKPNAEYGFSVMVTKSRRESAYSLSAYNRTFESLPTSAPRDLTPTAVEGEAKWVSLSWQPPRLPNGQVTGYLILYSTDAELDDREWVIEGISRGDQLNTVIRDLTPATTYYFKVQARNSKGMGPMSPTVIFRTPSVDGTGGGRVNIPTDYGKTHNDDPRYKNLPESEFNLDEYYNRGNQERTGGSATEEEPSKSAGIPPMVLYVSLASIGAVTVIAVFVVAVIMCRRKHEARGYREANKNPVNKPGPTPKPPDLWIHHEQGELKVDKNRDPEEMEEMKPLNPPEYAGLDGLMDTRRNSFISERLDRTYDERERYHRTPHRSKPITISLEHQPPPPQPIATAIPNGQAVVIDEDGVPLMPPGMRPMYPRTQYSTGQYMGGSTPRVHAMPPHHHDFSQPSSEDSYSTATMERRKPKLNHDALKAHGSTSMLTDNAQSPPLTSPTTSNQSAPIPYDQLPPDQQQGPPPGYPGTEEGEASVNSKSLPRPGNPLKSFKMPGPPTAVKPQGGGATSPYKKPNPPTSSSTNPAAGGGVSSPPIMKSQPRPPLPPATPKPPPDVTLRSDNESDIPKSFSTEELTAEMANLEGLMKDLNYITQQDFEC